MTPPKTLALTAATSAIIGLAAAAMATAAPNGASLATALPGDAEVSRIAGTQIIGGIPYFDWGVPLYRYGSIPGSTGVRGSAESSMRSVSPGGVTKVVPFIAEFETAAEARARVLLRTRADNGTPLPAPRIGSLARAYSLPDGGVYVRAAVGTAAIGTFVAGKDVETGTLATVATNITRTIARRIPAAAASEPPAVPAYLQARLVQPPTGWVSDGTIAAGITAAALDSSPGSGALKTAGWGTFQNIMGLAQASGITQVAYTSAHTAPPTAAGLEVLTTVIPFGSGPAAARMARVLPTVLPGSTAVPLAISGAPVTVALRTKGKYFVIARVASPRGDMAEIACTRQGLLTVSVSTCTDVITPMATAWVASNR